MCDKRPGVLRDFERLRRLKGGGSQDWLPTKLAIRLRHHRVDRFQLLPKAAQQAEAQCVSSIRQGLFGGVVNLHEDAVHARRHGRARQRLDELRLPARSVAAPPGNCTLWVASKTTGQPESRMILSPRMSTTRLL